MGKELFDYGKEKRAYIKVPLIIITSVILAGTTLFEKTSPLSVGFTGSLSGFDCILSAFSVAIGFLVRGSFTENIPTLISIAAVAAIRLFFGRSKGLPLKIVSCFLTGACVILSGLSSATVPSDILLSVSFGVISGTASYCLMSVGKALSEKSTLLFKPSEIACAAVVTVFGAAALSSVEIGIFNIGLVTGGIIVLLSGAVFRHQVGTFGAISALGLSIGGEQFIVPSIIICASGFFASLIKNHGKVLQLAAFLLSVAICSSLTGINDNTIGLIADQLISGAVFMILPLKEIIRRFSAEKEENIFSEPSEVFAHRLSFVASTVRELREAVEKTAQTLDGGVVHDISWVYNSACDSVCRNCRFNMECWGVEYNNSADEMNRLTGLLREGRTVGEDDFKGLIAARCSRKRQLAKELNRCYSEYSGARQSARKISEMRAVLSAQLVSTEKMFEEISKEFGGTDFNTQAAGQVENILERFGLSGAKCIVRKKNGNLLIEAYGHGELGVSAEELGDAITDALQKEFDLPDIIAFDGKVRISVFERTPFMIKTAACQYSRIKDKASGDYTDTYIDGTGHAYVILSDGMGSGARARIDSAFACSMLIKLLESGVGIESAIEMLNTSLLVKSSDESFATLDICEIDLYTGKVTVYKAGGADSFVKAGKNIVKLESSGLPVGISFRVSFENKSFTIAENDVVILTSDGVELPRNWLEQLFRKESSNDLDELVRQIGDNARFRSEKGREDDISVVAVQLCK